MEGGKGAPRAREEKKEEMGRQQPAGPVVEVTNRYG